MTDKHRTTVLFANPQVNNYIGHLAPSIKTTKYHRQDRCLDDFRKAQRSMELWRSARETYKNNIDEGGARVTELMAGLAPGDVGKLEDCKGFVRSFRFRVK